MTTETLKHYAPCPTHKVWHDQAQRCLLCLIAEAYSQPLPEVQR